MSDGFRTAFSANWATWGEALTWGVGRLRVSSSDTPSDTPDLDAQTLLAHVLDSPRATLLAYPERRMTEQQAGAFGGLIERRAAREPVAYLIGHREFMGLDFAADQRALIPRPETELLVEASIADVRRRVA